jgi:hypothetical protein
MGNEKKSKVESYEVARSNDRKIKFGQDYEMCGLFASYKAIINPEATLEEVKKISEDLYNQAKEEVEFEVLKLQNPGKALTGIAAIRELRSKVTKLEKENEELNNKVTKLEAPF